MYTETQKQEIERILSVFSGYLQSHPLIDLVWSDKIGYILLYISPDQAAIEMDPVLITDARLLCRMLLSEIATGVLVSAKNNHSIDHADPSEIAEIQKRWEPFLSQLTDYRDLAKLICPDSQTGIVRHFQSASDAV